MLHFSCGSLLASPVVPLCTARFNLKTSTFCALIVFMCFVWILNSIQEEIKSRLKSGNACYYSVQNILSSSVLSKNLMIKMYRTIILPVALCGCETWSLTLRKECRLKLFENRVLRRIFWPKRDEVTGEWRKLHKEELNDLYSSPSIVRLIKSRRMRWAGHVARMGAKRSVYRVSVGKPEGKTEAWMG